MRTTDSGRPTLARLSLRIALFTIVIVLLPARASAQELRPTLDEEGTRWVNLDRVELGAVDIDTSRFVAVAPDVYQVRTRWRFAKPQTSRDGYRYQTSVAVRAIDCRKRQAALIAFADHDGKNVMRTEAQPIYAARWDTVNPESIIDRITTRVCGRGTQERTVATAVGG